MLVLFGFEWAGSPENGTYGRPFGCLGDTNKEKTNSNHITDQSLPKEEIESNTIFPSLPPPAALPSNKWLRVSKLPWPLGRRFAVPLLSGPAAVRYLNPKLRLDPIGSDPFRFHRSSRFGLVLSDPTQELRTAGLFWAVERGEGRSCPFSLRARAGTSKSQTEYMYMTERHIIEYVI